MTPAISQTPNNPRTQIGPAARRIFVFLALLLSVCASESKAISRVQFCTDTKTTHTTGNATCTLTGVGTGHSLVAAIFTCGPISANDTFGVLGVTNSVTNSVSCNLRQNMTTLAVGNTGSNSGSETITVIVDGSVTIGASVIFEEWDAAITLDQHTAASNTSGGAGTISSGNAATSSDGEFLVAIGKTFGNQTLTAGTGYTFADSLAVPDYGQDTGLLAIETKVGGAAGTEAGTFSQTGAGTWEICFATFTFSAGSTKVRC